MGKKRWTLLLALGLVAGGLLWVVNHPELLTPYFARLATRHLLRDSDGDLQIGSFSGNMLTGLRLYDVTLSLRGERGAAVDVGIDTLTVDYRFSELLQAPLRLRHVAVSGAECLARRGEAPDPETAAEPGGPFTLPRFRVDDLDVRRSTMSISGPRGRVEEVFDGIAWRGTVKADTSLVLVCQRGELAWPSRDTVIRDLHGLVTVDGERITAEQISCGVNEHEVTAAGHRTHGGDVSLRVTADDISTGEIEELIDMSLGFAAAGDTRLHLTTRADSLWLDISFRGELEGYELEGMQGASLLADDVLTWHSLEGRINGAWFSGTGAFDLHDAADVSFQLRGDVSDVNLARGLVPDMELPETDGWGWLNLWRRDGTDETRISGWLRDGHLAGVPFDSVRVSLEGDTAGVTFHELELRHAAQTAHLSGYADTSGAFLGRLEIAAADLSLLPADWPLPPLSGAVQISGTLTGQDPVYDFEGVAALAAVELGPVSLREGRAELSVENLLGVPKVSAELAGRELVCAGVELGTFTTGGVVTSEAAILHHFRSQHGDTTLTFRGQADIGEDGASYYLPQLEITLEGNSWRLEDAARFRTGDGYFELEQTSVVSDWGALRGRAVWDEVGDNLDGEVVLERLDLELVNPFLNAESDLNGELSASLSLGGTPYEPLLGLEARLDDCVLPLATIDSLTVAALFYEDTFDIRRLDLHSDYGRVEAAGLVSHYGVDPEEFWPGAELDLHLDVTGGDWAFIDQFAIPSLDRIAGTFDGSLDLAGTTDRPLLEGTVASAPFHVHWLHLDELLGSVGYADGQLTLGGLNGHKESLALSGRIELPLELDLYSDPVSAPDGPLSMQITIPPDTDLAAPSRTCNAFVVT
ncbi:hypothetical protein H8E07_10300, partial [bacterium]|nr:hypothetical protein [bacterium]